MKNRRALFIILSPSNLNVPVFACTPGKFPELMAAAISKQDVGQWAAKEELVLKK